MNEIDPAALGAIGLLIPAIARALDPHGDAGRAE